MVTVPVYGEDTNVTENYDNDEPLYNLSLVNSSITFTGLNKDTTYYIGFDLNEDLKDYDSSKSYVFRKLNTETNEYDYYAFASFTPKNDENKIIIDSNYLEPISNFSSEQLEEIFSTGEIMELAPVTQCFTINACYNKKNTNYSYSFDFERWNESSSSTTDTWISYKESGTNSFHSSKQICGTHSSGYSTSGTLNGRSVTVSNHGSINPIADTCVTTKECDPVGSSTTCTYASSATQTYKWNSGESCIVGDGTSSTRTKAATYKTCNSNYQWNSCGTSSWTGSVNPPSCSKSDTTEDGTTYFSGNENSETFSKANLSKPSEGTSRAVRWNWNGWDSNYSTTFTSSHDTWAQFSINKEKYGSWSNVTLPTAFRRGYTFKGWIYYLCWSERYYKL